MKGSKNVVSMIMTIVVCGGIFIALKVYLHKIDYYYHSEYDRKNRKENKNPHTGGNR